MNDLNEYITSVADTVSKRLEALLSENMESVVTSAMKYSAQGGGKRIRPLLTVEFSKACGGNFEAAVDFGCAVEMIHTYSLIHDDLPCMDNDDMRRGKPSCHIAFGEDNALLAGDALLTEAFCVLSCVRSVSKENIVKAVSFLSSFAGINGMVGGQVLDLQFENETPTVEEVTKMYSLKTCALIKAAAVLGCLTSENCTQREIKAACNYGENLGIAFQIVDDILDIVGDEKTLGKPVGSDDKNDKSTVVKYLGIEKSKEYVKELTAKAIDSLKDINGDTSVLEQIALLLADRTY
ncbi:MAG: polyprenyl synthetase family protein [Candidatus Fimenecus sp.]